jgi:DNA-binding NarL/FixJ family response regulator
VRDSIRAGLMTARERDELEIHPLCRAFLERKLWDIDDSRDQVDALAAFLIETSQWDDSFELIRRFVLVERLPLLIERGLRRVLAGGGLAAVEKWVSWADEQQLEPPELALVRAEIYLRRGDLELSESLALTCVPTLHSPELTAQAHLCAGAAAHLLDQVDRAWNHYGKALESDASPDIRRRALWGRFIASYWTRQPDSRSALEALEQAGDPSPNHLLRLGQAKLVVAEQKGDLSEALTEALAAEPLLSHVEDPIVRSGYLNTVAHALGLAARYSEAEIFSTRQIDEARRFHLEFAHPTALLNLASAKLGLGLYTAAAALVEKSQRIDATHDSFLRVKREIIRACIALSRGDAATARSALSATPLDVARSDIAGEALATRALTEACSGEIHGAEQTMDAAKQLARDVSSQVLLAATAAILALEADAATLEESLQTFAGTVSATGCFDSAICAMRAYPKLLDASTQSVAMKALIRVAAERSGDSTLAMAVGATIRRGQQGTLTTREREVLGLAAEGFHNEQIGQRLFISPKTVKTHLQNIYEKLDVSSRTQAVTKANEAGLLR